MSLLPLIIQLISGAVGGNLAGTLMKKFSLGTLWNSVAGIIGGVSAANCWGCWGLRQPLAGGSGKYCRQHCQRWRWRWRVNGNHWSHQECHGQKKMICKILQRERSRNNANGVFMAAFSERCTYKWRQSNGCKEKWCFFFFFFFFFF